MCPSVPVEEEQRVRAKVLPSASILAVVGEAACPGSEGQKEAAVAEDTVPPPTPVYSRAASMGSGPAQQVSPACPVGTALAAGHPAWRRRRYARAAAARWRNVVPVLVVDSRPGRARARRQDQHRPASGAASCLARSQHSDRARSACAPRGTGPPAEGCRRDYDPLIDCCWIAVVAQRALSVDTQCPPCATKLCATANAAHVLLHYRPSRHPGLASRVKILLFSPRLSCTTRHSLLFLTSTTHCLLVEHVQYELRLDSTSQA